jgi:predicted nicotinamide N-methyase
VSSLLEIRRLPPAWPATPAGLPDVPGGWTESHWTIAGRAFPLIVPAVPDAFLDDADTVQRHQQQGYMPYWAYLWPAALPMAAAVLSAGWPPETSVLELGSGLGLVGLAALSAGWQVTFSDYDPVAVELALFNARRLNLRRATGLLLDWRRVPERQFPVILGCELLYEDGHHELLLDVLDRLLAPGGEAWFGDGGRARAARFGHLLERGGYAYTLWDEDQRPLQQFRVGQFQLLRVKSA